MGIKIPNLFVHFVCRVSRWTSGGTAFPRGTKLLFYPKHAREFTARSPRRVFAAVSHRRTSHTSFRFILSHKSRWTYDGDSVSARYKALLFIQNTHANSPRGLRAAAGRTETAVRTNAVRKNINRCEIRLRTRQKDKLSNSVAVLNYSGNTASIVKRYH